MDLLPGVPAGANPRVYILWLLRSGRVHDFESLAREFGFVPTDYSMHAVLGSWLVGLEHAGLIVTADRPRLSSDGGTMGGRFPRQIRLSGKWEKIQLALDVSLTELTKLGPRAIITTPYFGKPKPTARSLDLFVLMPFTEQLRPVYDDHILNCASELGLSVARGDDFFTAHSIMGDIWNAISAARAIIADCTGRNPNVFYEIGLAHAVGKPVILITQNGEDVPFDIRHLRYIQYDLTPRGMRIFEKQLVDTLKTELLLGEDSTAKAITRIAFIYADESEETRARLDQEYLAVFTELEAARAESVFSLHRLEFARLAPWWNCSIMHFVGQPYGLDALVAPRKEGTERLDPWRLEAAFRSHRDEVEWLVELMLKMRPQCVILSECFSEEQAKAIARQVPYVIGIHADIGEAAISFAVEFYKSLNAGRSIVEAHEIASNRVRLEGASERGIPILMRGN